VTYLFSKRNAALLERFLTARVLLAFDFDGTLAPIVVDPAAARMRRRTLKLFERVCRLYPCAVISGRQRHDVLQRLEGAPVRHVVGNHGLGPEGATEALVREIAALRGRMAAALDGREGVVIEDKTYSFAVHYRRARDRRRARDDVERALAQLPRRFRAIRGKQVVDVVAGDVPNKGQAMKRLLAAEAAEAAIYVGDDETDEDVFRSPDAGSLLSIRVGRSRRSAAACFVHDQRELDVLLDRVASARVALA
jgi:trehalose 6-phosphate phosphatase